MRLDVEKRRSVEAIEAGHDQPALSTRRKATMEEAMGLGRTGERMAKVPAGSFPVAAWMTRSRRASFIQ